MRRRWLAWTALAGVVLALGWLPRRERSTGLAERLLGPVAGLAANVQWVRADAAMQAGRSELAFARAQLALRLDPGSPEGWEFLAGWQAFDMASMEREPDARRREAWLRAGLETAARGEQRSRAPAEMALLQGVILVKIAETEAPNFWPGGLGAVWRGAAEHFERAHELGNEAAGGAAHRAWEHAGTVRH